MSQLDRLIAFLGDVIRNWEFCRSKVHKISFQSVQLPFSGDITEKSYGTIELDHLTLRIARKLWLKLWNE